jgi:repressor LexA
MNELTQRQREVLGFIQSTQSRLGAPPTLREIAGHFGFRSLTAAADHVRALRHKGVLTGPPRRARGLRVVSAAKTRRVMVEIPIYGAISAGFAQDRQQETKGCVPVDLASLGIPSTARTFALEVHGDSMIGRHIMDGDLVILEHGMNPRNGDVVAALIDNESTLKTLVMERGKSWLRAENPKYPLLTPAQELVIQGVMVALIRKRQG